MAKYMRSYRARKAADLAKLRAKAEQREPEVKAMFAQIIEAVTALTERVGRLRSSPGKPKLCMRRV
jgi:hypothetical protein